MCSFFHACSAGAVIGILIAFGVVFLCVGLALAALVRAWRVGSMDRNIDTMIRDARDRAYWHGRQGD